MKKYFTDTERSIINAICSLYHIQTISDKDGVFKGLIPSKGCITLNGTYFMQLLNTTNVVYIENRGYMNILVIVAQ